MATSRSGDHVILGTGFIGLFRSEVHRSESQMMASLKSVVSLSIAIMFGHAPIGVPQGKNASWLDEAKPASWNTPGASIPEAPAVQGAVARCRQTARPPQLDEDKRVRDKGWDLVGAYQGGW